jgi:citrate lyase subunit beta/citryl-CoA lyase
MEETEMNKRVIRSILMLPVNNPRFVEKAYLRRADAIVLDLEDAIPATEKNAARQRVKDSIPLAGRGGARVLARINNDPKLLPFDVEACIYPGLDGVVLPKAESAEDLDSLSTKVEKLERDRGIELGHTKFFVHIESPRGLLKVKEIATASSRVEAMNVGPEDYCLELGIEPSLDGLEMFYAVSKVITVCKAYGISPVGNLGSIGGFRDLEGFERSVIRARQLGCEGAYCIHPDQVEVLNSVFSPSQEKIEYARRVIEAFEVGLKRGTASVSLDGKMVDIPVYNRARIILERAHAIAELERRKSEALARLR